MGFYYFSKILEKLEYTFSYQFHIEPLDKR